MTWGGLIWLTVLAWKLYNYNPVISLEKMNNTLLLVLKLHFNASD